MAQKILELKDERQLAALFGSYDENIRLLEKEYGVGIVAREGEIKISGDEGEVGRAAAVIENLELFLTKGESLSEQTIRYVMGMVDDGRKEELERLVEDSICITSRGRAVKPKTVGQKKYIEAIKKNTVVLSIGPAGTGKTYLAVAMAVTAFRNKEVAKIVLTRPAVEAGEKLGFLPGDLQNKVDPYLRPLYDSLFDMLGGDAFHRLMEAGKIEVAPLAYMRGRTLDDSFIILDEAQNTTPEQMKMFLTRMGFNSKSVITGDITQIDIQEGKKSGLKEAKKILKNIEGIETVTLTNRDVVRHALVQKIIEAYEKYEGEQNRVRRRKID